MIGENIYDQNPNIKVIKRDIPSVYLDTNILIEMNKCMVGKCTDAHKKEITDVFNFLLGAMKNGSILCPLGNQFPEMAASINRSKPRAFLLNFTNAQMDFPETIENKELNLGYSSFMNTRDKQQIQINSTDFYNQQADFHPHLKDYTGPVFEKDQLENKKILKETIRGEIQEAKQDGRIENSIDSQFKTELLSDFQVLSAVCSNYERSQLDFQRYIKILGPILSRISFPENNDLSNYINFLHSPYHHKLPFVWIRSMLWAYRMQNDAAIKCGDNMDTKWAAAYLPFVDYAITDNAFCDLLNTSGIAQLYHTKVYSFRTLKDFLADVKGMKIDC